MANRPMTLIPAPIKIHFSNVLPYSPLINTFPYAGINTMTTAQRSGQITQSGTIARLIINYGSQNYGGAYLYSASFNREALCQQFEYDQVGDPYRMYNFGVSFVADGGGIGTTSVIVTLFNDSTIRFTTIQPLVPGKYYRGGSSVYKVISPVAYHQGSNGSCGQPFPATFDLPVNVKCIFLNGFGAFPDDVNWGANIVNIDPSVTQFWSVDNGFSGFNQCLNLVPPDNIDFTSYSSLPTTSDIGTCYEFGNPGVRPYFTPTFALTLAQMVTTVNSSSPSIDPGNQAKLFLGNVDPCYMPFQSINYDGHVCWLPNGFAIFYPASLALFTGDTTMTAWNRNGGSFLIDMVNATYQPIIFSCDPELVEWNVDPGIPTNGPNISEIVWGLDGLYLVNNTGWHNAPNSSYCLNPAWGCPEFSIGVVDFVLPPPPPVNYQKPLTAFSCTAQNIVDLFNA